MPTPKEWGLIAAASVAIAIGVGSWLYSQANSEAVAKEAAIEEPAAIHRMLDIGVYQEGTLGFNEPGSPIIIRNVDGSYRISCPIGSKPTADEETPFIHDGYCAPYHPLPAPDTSTPT